MMAILCGDSNALAGDDLRALERAVATLGRK